MSHHRFLTYKLQNIYLRHVAISDYDLTRVGIRWIQNGEHEGANTFSGFIIELRDMEVLDTVEKVFEEWIEEGVKIKNVVVTALEIYVDGTFYPLSREEEERYMIRIGSSSNSSQDDGEFSPRSPASA